MKALLKEGGRVQLQTLPQPEAGPGEVLIRVRAAGLCRTDALVIAGELPSANPLIPGHELAGEIAEIGEGVSRWSLGDKVTVHPLIGCGTCPSCSRRRPEHCPQARMIGVERHGGFAEYLALPAHALWQLPADSDWLHGAYTEPVAAILGVFRADIRPEQQGWVLGSNRIAGLTSRLLALKGFSAGQGALDTLAPNSLDYLIESGLTAADLPRIVEVLRPGGQLIAKSRHLGEISLSWNQLVRKDLRVQGLYYGDFAEAVALIASHGRELLQGLIGQQYLIEDWERFLAPGEQSKPFLVLP